MMMIFMLHSWLVHFETDFLQYFYTACVTQSRFKGNAYWWLSVGLRSYSNNWLQQQIMCVHVSVSCPAHGYGDASLIRVRKGERISTNPFAYNGKRKVRWDRGRISACKAPPDLIKCFHQHSLAGYSSPYLHVREVTYLKGKQFTQGSNAWLKA